MSINNLSKEELISMLIDLQDLVDGRYLTAFDIEDDTGVGRERSVQILASVQKLKGLKLQSIYIKEDLDVLAEYTGDGKVRQWASVGAWLYPGDKIAII